MFEPIQSIGIDRTSDWVGIGNVARDLRSIDTPEVAHRKKVGRRRFRIYSNFEIRRPVAAGNKQDRSDIESLAAACMEDQAFLSIKLPCVIAGGNRRSEKESRGKSRMDHRPCRSSTPRFHGWTRRRGRAFRHIASIGKIPGGDIAIWYVAPMGCHLIPARKMRARGAVTTYPHEDFCSAFGSYP
jgi:hypothetical protein